MLTTQEDFLARYTNPSQVPRAAFLTGGAGTGKTYVVSQLLEQLPLDYPYALTAPTGVAALNLGGTTLHSFFRAPFQLRDPVSQAHYNLRYLGRDKKATLCALRLLIIDEVSMVRSDLMDFIDHTLRAVRGNEAPFGGVRVLAIGDPFQLPPVVPRHETLAEPWFFQSRAWLDLAPESFVLTHCYRQNDIEFVSLLNQLRKGSLSFEQLAILGKRVAAKPRSEKAVILSTLNRSVDSINNARLAALSKPEFTNTAETELTAAAPAKFNPLRLVPAVEHLALRSGARVMMLNNDYYGRWVNGSLGTFQEVVTRDEQELLRIELDEGGLVEVAQYTWELTDYEQDKNFAWAKKLLATVKQYPVRLGWATTVHKSQGLSLPRVHFQLDWVFESGQVYVALSRAVLFEGLTLSEQLRNKHVLVSRPVKEFYKQLEREG